MEYIKSEKLSTHIGEVPTDNVWFTSDYPEPYFSFDDAVNRHKLMAMPSIYDYMDNYVFVNMILNTWTNREGVFTSMLKSVIVPHPFVPPVKARLAFLTKQKEYVSQALECGATHAGGTELLAQIQADQISIYELDHVLATPDMAKQLKALRPLFGEMFPNEKKGSMGEDIPAMVGRFLNGVMLKIEHTKTKGVANIKFPIGKLNMTNQELSANLDALKMEIFGARPLKATGKYVLHLDIEVPPSPTKYKLDPVQYDLTESVTKKKRR
ncbi:large ribosomal subunit protein uL1-like isoform X2 [Argopecten irradians]